MQPPQQHSRINIAELKAQIVRKLGPEGSKQYFHYLNRLINLKLSQDDFNKLCFRILGREDVALHNKFIRAILKNASTAKVPPPSIDNDSLLKLINAVGNKENPIEGGYQNGTHASTAPATNAQGLPNGDILPLSPRKTRTVYRDRRSGDRRSALGPNGKTNLASQQLASKESSDFALILENGVSDQPEIQEPAEQHHQRIMQQADQEREGSAHLPINFSAIKGSPDGPISVHSKDQIEVTFRGEGTEVYTRSQLQAPLGVPLCPVSVGGARRAMPVESSSKCVSTLNSGVLLDSATLRERMGQIAVSQGLEGVSMDCANLLNNGLDAYLKGLISSSVELAAARSGHVPVRNQKQQAYMKLLNGVRPGHLCQIQNSGRPLEVMTENRPRSPVSLQDFRVAMELNPKQLGEDWPLLLEKICSNSYEE